MNELEKQDLNTLPEAEKDSYSIDSLSEASWAMRKLKASHDQDKDNEELIKNEKQRLDDWLKKENEQNANSRSYLEGKLQEYLEELRKDDPKARIKTPYGDVSTRKKPAGIYWENEKQVIDSLKSQGLDNLVQTKESINKPEFKKQFGFVGNHLVNHDGVVIKGATYKAPEEQVTFKFPKENK